MLVACGGVARTTEADMGNGLKLSCAGRGRRGEEEAGGEERVVEEEEEERGSAGEV